MFDEDQDALTADEAGAGGIFPFLSVLISTIGVLVFILVAGSLGQSLGGENIAATVHLRRADIAKIHALRLQTATKLRQRREEVKSATTLTQEREEETQGILGDVAQIEEGIGEINVALVDEESRVAEIENDTAAQQTQIKMFGQLRKRIEQVKLLQTARSKNTEVTTKYRQVAGERAKLEDVVGTLAREHDDLAEKAKAPKVSFIFSGTGAEKDPVIVDLHDTYALVITSPLDTVAQQERVEHNDLALFFDSLASELATRADKTYALFLVRPDAIDTFVEAKRAFQKWRAPYRHEPFDDHWTPGTITKEGSQ
jgi:hypothetical protein